MARTETFYKMGFRMPWPEALEHTKGMLSPMEIGDMGNGTYFMMCSYFAATAEEIAAMGAKAKGGEMSEEDSQKAADAMGVLLVIIGIEGGLSIKEIKEKMQMGSVSDDSFIEVGRYKDITYYAVTDHDSEEAFMKAQKPEFAEEFRTLQKVFIDTLKNAHQGVLKFQVYFSNPGLRIPITETIRETFPNVSVASTLATNVEITSGGADKGKALKALCGYLQIPIESTVAFGDGVNDMTLLSAAGYGVAVRNAMTEVFSAADAITDSNNNDGVARFIEQYLLR